MKYTCLSGNFNYSTNNYADMHEILGLTSKIDPRFLAKVVCSKYYVPIVTNSDKLIEAI